MYVYSKLRICLQSGGDRWPAALGPRLWVWGGTVPASLLLCISPGLRGDGAASGERTCHVIVRVCGTANLPPGNSAPERSPGTFCLLCVQRGTDLWSGKSITHSGLQPSCGPLAYGPQGANWLHDTTSSLCVWLGKTKGRKGLNNVKHKTGQASKNINTCCTTTLGIILI